MAYTSTRGRSAADINFENAVRYRQKQTEANLLGQDPGGSVAIAPGWDAFHGGLDRAEEDATANGMGFRADLSGIGQFDDPRAGGRLTSTDRAGIAGNIALGNLTDQSAVQQLKLKAVADQQRDAAIEDAKKSYADQVAASFLPPPRAHVQTETDAANGTPEAYTLRPAVAETDRERLLASLPPPARAAYEAQFAAQDKERASTAATNADTAVKTGAGSLPDYLARTAASLGKPLSELTPQEVSKAREDYLTTTAMAGVQGPKVQQALEQQYRGVLQKEMSSRSGGLGTEDGKVNQAIHLIALMEQNKDPKTGEYNIPKSQYAELASGLATLVSPNGRPTDSMRSEIEQRTAKGDINGALTYITGTPMTGSTQDIFKVLRDSIDRQGRVAETNRQKYFDALRAQAPTDLSPDRRASLEKALKLNSLTDATGGAPGASGATVKLQSPDGKSTRDVPADQVEHYLAQGAKRVGA